MRANRRVRPVIVRGGLTLKGHGRRRALKGRPGRDTRPVRLWGGHRAGHRETFYGPVPALRFQAQAQADAITIAGRTPNRLAPGWRYWAPCTYLDCTA